MPSVKVDKACKVATTPGYGRVRQASCLAYVWRYAVRKVLSSGEDNTPPSSLSISASGLPMCWAIAAALGGVPPTTVRQAC